MKRVFSTHDNSMRFVAISFLFAFLIGILIHNDSHFASAYTPGGMISGYVYQDNNLNGQRNPVDTDLPGQNVTLTGKLSDQTIVGPITVKTNATGRYSFSGLAPGNYNVTDAIVPGWGPTSNPVVSNIQIVAGSKFLVNFGVQNLLLFINPRDFNGENPEQLVFDSGGNLYDPQYFDGKIKKFDKNGNLEAIIGSQGTGYGQFFRPTGVALDSNGNIWAADQNNTILKFDKNGTFLMKFGTKGNSTGQLKWPRGLAVDGQDNLYVADGNNNRVMKFDKNGNYLMTIGNGGGWINGYFVVPYEVAFDSHGNIYVVDTGNDRIQKFASNGTFLASYGDSGTGLGQFNRPRAIYFGPNDDIYVADAYNSRIQVFDSNFTFIESFGTFGSGPGQFSNPSGVAADDNGTIYVADSSNARMEKFDSTGNFQSQFLTRGSAMQPYFLTLDNSGHLLVTDGTNDLVLTFDAQSGSYLSQFGSVGAGPGQFHGPRGIKIDQSGSIIVGDNYNNRVEKFDSKGKFLWSSGSAGTGPGQFDEARGVIIDASGNISVSDSLNNRLNKFDPNGNFLSSINVPNPYGINIDSQGNIYVAEFYSNYVEKFAPNGTSLLKVGGPGTGNGQFTSPRDVFVDKGGNMYVVDKGGARVEKFDKNGTFLMKFGSFGSGNKQFDNPRGIIVDSAGNIWVADAGNGRVSEYTGTGTLIKNIPFYVSGVNVTGTASRPPHSNGWYTSPVTITWTGSEIGTGIASCDPPVTYSGPNARGAIIVGHCIDKEGVTGTGAVQINYSAATIPTSLTLQTNSSSIPWHHSLTIAGKLTNSSGNGVGGKTINFNGTAVVGGSIHHVTTNPDGTFSEVISSPRTVSNWTVQATFAGDTKYGASSSPIANFSTIKHHVIISLWIAPTAVTGNTTYTVNGILIDYYDSISPLVSRQITFTSTTPIVIPNAITDLNGHYAVKLTSPTTAGSYNIAANFAGDSLYIAKTTLTKTLTVK
jgi:streptogramin lyase